MECLLSENSEKLENKRCHNIGIDSVEKNWEETSCDETMEDITQESLAPSVEPFPVIQMLLSKDFNMDSPTLTLTNSQQQVVSFDPFKELYFSKGNQGNLYISHNSNKTTPLYTCENNTTYEIVPYIPEKDIKNDSFWLQSIQKNNNRRKTQSTLEAMELENSF